MNFLETVLVWAGSLKEWFAERDVQLTFGQSEGDRPKHSCWVTLKHGDREAELLLWDSGEAELNRSDPIEGLTQEHHQLNDLGDLVPILRRLIIGFG